MSGLFLIFLLLPLLVRAGLPLPRKWETECAPDRACFHVEFCYSKSGRDFEFNADYIASSRPIRCKDGAEAKRTVVRLELKFADPEAGLHVLAAFDRYEADELDIEFGSKLIIKINKKSRRVEIMHAGGEVDKFPLTLKKSTPFNISAGFHPLPETHVDEFLQNVTMSSVKHGGKDFPVIPAEWENWKTKIKELGGRVCQFSQVHDACNGESADCEKFKKAVDKLQCGTTIWAKTGQPEGSESTKEWTALTSRITCEDHKWTTLDSVGAKMLLGTTKVLCSTREPNAPDPSPPKDQKGISMTVIGVIAGSVVVIVILIIVTCCFIMRKTTEKRRGHKHKKRAHKRRWKGIRGKKGLGGYDAETEVDGATQGTASATGTGTASVIGATGTDSNVVSLPPGQSPNKSNVLVVGGEAPPPPAP